MKSQKKSAWIRFGLAFFVSLILLMIATWNLGIHDEQDKSLNHRLTLLLISIVMSLLGIAFCYVIGLLIRLSNTIKNWWHNQIYVQLFLITIGSILLFLSLHIFFSSEFPG